MCHDQMEHHVAQNNDKNRKQVERIRKDIQIGDI
jgi:hypothetical protein